jgi:hypothetical protein
MEARNELATVLKAAVLRVIGNETTPTKMTVIFIGRSGYSVSANALKESKVRRVNASCAFANGERIIRQPRKQVPT